MRIEPIRQEFINSTDCVGTEINQYVSVNYSKTVCFSVSALFLHAAPEDLTCFLSVYM